MRYVSTRGRAPALSFEDVLLGGLADDGGLYMPAVWPRWSGDDLRDLAGMDYPALAARVLAPFAGGAVCEDGLREVAETAYRGFGHGAVAPLRQVDSRLWLMELFHGPSLAFKDLAMQVLGLLFDRVLKRRGTRITIVGATSGDTGSAAIEACRDRDMLDVFVLFPHGRVSAVQRRQMTTVAAPNVHALAVEGTFDDCQALVKALFGDAPFRDRHRVCAVNSINWVRVAAQIVYYVAAAVALGAPDRRVAFAVPTGNFGNVFAGYGAWKMGLPVEALVVGTNRNDILARFLDSGRMVVGPVHPTLSPSMDIQVSSNFERLLFEVLDRDGAAVEGLMARFARDGRYALPDDRWRAPQGAVLRPSARRRRSQGGDRRHLPRDGHAGGPPHGGRPVGGPGLARGSIHPRRGPGHGPPGQVPGRGEGGHGGRPVPAPSPGRHRRADGAAERAAQRPGRGEGLHRLPPGDGTGGVTVRADTLPSGLRIVTDTMESVETVSLGVWVAAGTRHESPDVNGVSHFLEHMAFKGTERRSAQDIAEEIEAVGGHLNAHTSREYTAFYAKMLKGDAALAVDIIADIVQNAVFDPEELERERAVILQEIRQANDTPDDIVFDHFQAAAFPDQGLGRPVLGTADSVQAMPRERIRAYMRDSYAAPRIIAAAAGRIDHDRHRALVEAAFGRLPHGDVPDVPAARYGGGDYRESRDLEQVQLVLGFEGMPFADPDFYGASVFSTLFGGGMSSRLFQEIRERRGLAYSVYSFLSAYSDAGLFAVHAGTGSAELEELVPVLCGEIGKVVRSVGEDEVTRARAQLKASILMSLESTSARCEQAARQLMVFGRPLSPAEIIRRIEAVDAATVLRAARRILASPITLAALGPVDNLPTRESLVHDIAGRMAA